SSRPLPACSLRWDSLVPLLGVAIALPFLGSSARRSRCSTPSQAALRPTNISALRPSGTRTSPTPDPWLLRPRSCAASPIPSAPQGVLGRLLFQTKPQLGLDPWLRLVRACMLGRSEPAIPGLRSRLSPEDWSPLAR